MYFIPLDNSYSQFLSSYWQNYPLYFHGCRHVLLYRNGTCTGMEDHFKNSSLFISIKVLVHSNSRHPPWDYHDWVMTACDYMWQSQQSWPNEIHVPEGIMCFPLEEPNRMGPKYSCDSNSIFFPRFSLSTSERENTLTSHDKLLMFRNWAVNNKYLHRRFRDLFLILRKKNRKMMNF